MPRGLDDPPRFRDDFLIDVLAGGVRAIAHFIDIVETC
jgi:hypothetical protein